MPRLICIGGLSGAGKSTVAHAVAERLPAHYIDKDAYCSDYVDAMLVARGGRPGDRDSALYREVVRPAEYARFIDGLCRALADGQDVVADAPFLTEFPDTTWRTSLEDRVASASPGSSVSYFWISCELDTTKQRMLSRGAERDRVKMTVWEDYVKFASKISVPPPPVIEISNRGDVEAAIRQVITDVPCQ